jgi:Integrase core domain
MAGHMRQELVVDALEMAISRRWPPKGTIHHSDHGGQFIGLTFGQTCHDAGIAQSMGAVGTCYDNAVAETFFATLTKELLLHNTPKGGWATRAELRSAIFEYTEGFYNPVRLHSTLGMRSPAEYEADHAAGDPDGLAHARTHARARAKKLLITEGYQQLLRLRPTDSTEPGEVQVAGVRCLGADGLAPVRGDLPRFRAARADHRVSLQPTPRTVCTIGSAPACASFPRSRCAWLSTVRDGRAACGS